MSKPKIFVFVNGKWSDDVVGCAIAEDGRELAAHVSSNDHWFRYDMGLSSDRKHERYHIAYPEGYELVEADLNEPTPEFQAALDKAKARNDTPARN